jgi:hypothetical protein
MRLTADQLRCHVPHVFPPLLGWVQVSQAQSILGKMEGMMEGCAGGGKVALRITGVQNTKKEKAKILPVDGACNFCPDQLGCVRLPRPVRVHRLPQKLGLCAAAPIGRVECGRGVK